MKKSQSVFTHPFAEALRVDLALRQLLSLVISTCSKSRAEIAAEMSTILGVEIKPSALNLWTAPSRPESRFPCIFADAFCRATGDDRLQRFLLGPRLCGLLEVGESVIRVSQRLGERRDSAEKRSACAS
jgi:hypothetical protein